MVVRWWVVANPKLWQWDRLFETGHVRFRLGKLEKHFPLLKVGDVVAGYESSPRRRLVALATVSRPFGVNEEGVPAHFELAPLSRLSRGLGYEDLRNDATLARSEPMRCRNQGTLFALSEPESEQLLRLLTTAESTISSLATPIEALETR